MGEWYGKPLTARGLAKLLKRYGIKSRMVRFDEGTHGTKRGLLREQFEDAWTRYLPSTGGSIRHNDTTRSGSGIEPNPYPTQDGRVSDLKLPANPHGERVVSDVSDTAAGGGPESPQSAPTCDCSDSLFMADQHGVERCAWCNRGAA